MWRLGRQGKVWRGRYSKPWAFLPCSEILLDGYPWLETAPTAGTMKLCQDSRARSLRLDFAERARLLHCCVLFLLGSYVPLTFVFLNSVLSLGDGDLLVHLPSTLIAPSFPSNYHLPFPHLRSILIFQQPSSQAYGPKPPPRTQRPPHHVRRPGLRLPSLPCRPSHLLLGVVRDLGGLPVGPR